MGCSTCTGGSSSINEMVSPLGDQLYSRGDWTGEKLIVLEGEEGVQRQTVPGPSEKQGVMKAHGPAFRMLLLSHNACVYTVTFRGTGISKQSRRPWGCPVSSSLGGLLVRLEGRTLCLSNATELTLGLHCAPRSFVELVLLGAFF